MTPVPTDLDSFAQPVVNAAAGLSAVVPEILAVVVVIAGGLIAVRLGFRIVRSIAK